MHPETMESRVPVRGRPMLRSVRLMLLAMALGLGACAGESLLGRVALPELQISPSGDSLELMLTSLEVVTAAVYVNDEPWAKPQPAIEWSVTNLSGVVTVTAGADSASLSVTGVELGLARLIARAPSLGLSDTVVVRVWSPVVSLLFELDQDTVFHTGSIGWRLEARDAEGALVASRLSSVRTSSDSVAQIILGRSATARSVGTATLTATAPPLSVERQITVVPLFIDAITLGNRHDCVVREGARIMCSGDNAFLQLGLITPLHCIGSQSQYCTYGGRSYIDVPEIGDAIAVDAAEDYACAIRVGGELLCWGASDHGQLGTTVDNSRCGNSFITGISKTCLRGPRSVQTSQRFRMLSAGGSTACALTLDDQAWCWGSTYDGARLGNGSAEGSVTPVAVSGGHSFRTIAAGVHTTCAVDFSNAAWCWGAGAEGELGAGPGVATAAVPTRVVGDIEFLTVEHGMWGTCGLSTSGQAFCWGGANSYRGSTPLPEGCADEASPNSCVSIPLAVAGALRFTELIVGELACGATAAGAVWCWRADAPQPVTGVPPLSRIATGMYRGCGISAVQFWHCWNNSNLEGRAESAHR